MNIAFTICSNNYLAHAKTLGDSFLDHHPDVKFIIGLVDKFNCDLDYKMFSNFEIIPVEDISIPDFENLNLKYNITELNTAVKPAYFKHIFKKYNAGKVVYIDPDIFVASSFDEVFDILDSQNIVVTPHMCSPIDDDLSPTDYHVLAGGVFNLGFIGLSNYESVKPFLNWWFDRVVKYGFRNYSKGMFYDQLWINYVPCFFDHFHILKHPGYNMANWNLHERTITSHENGVYKLNHKHILRFFHFSSYKFNNPQEICIYQTRYNFTSRPDLVEIFNIYNQKLIENNVIVISKLEVFYYPNLNKLILQKKDKTKIDKIIFRVKKAARVLIYG